MITSCTKCTSLYEAGSEEQAKEPVRLCPVCRAADLGCLECGFIHAWEPCAL